MSDHTENTFLPLFTHDRYEDFDMFFKSQRCFEWSLLLQDTSNSVILWKSIMWWRKNVKSIGSKFEFNVFSPVTEPTLLVLYTHRLMLQKLFPKKYQLFESLPLFLFEILNMVYIQYNYNQVKKWPKTLPFSVGNVIELEKHFLFPVSNFVTFHL